MKRVLEGKIEISPNKKSKLADLKEAVIETSSEALEESILDSFSKDSEEENEITVIGSSNSSLNNIGATENSKAGKVENSAIDTEQYQIKYQSEAREVVDNSVDSIVELLSENNRELVYNILQDVLSIRKENLYSHNVFNKILEETPELERYADIVSAIGTLTRLVIGRVKIDVGQKMVLLNETHLIDDINNYLSHKLDDFVTEKGIEPMGHTLSDFSD